MNISAWMSLVDTQKQHPISVEEFYEHIVCGSAYLTSTCRMTDHTAFQFLLWIVSLTVLLKVILTD
jgi:hypothetical protein